MKCPLDVDVDLVMTGRQGVEIDYCPTCRGVWLDRGELDKILDRAAGQAPVAPPPPTGHAAGHVSGEGGHGAGAEPPPGYGYAPGPYGGGAGGSSGYGSGGHRPGGYDRDDDDRRRDDRDDDRRDDRRGGYGDDRGRYGEGRGGYGGSGYDSRRTKRKESWLGDLLDFG